MGQRELRFAWQDIPAEARMQLREELTGAIDSRLTIADCTESFPQVGDVKSGIPHLNCGYNRLGMLGYVITTAALAAAASAGYQSMAPTGQWYGTTFTGSGGGAKQLALTYDDGPNDPHTLRLLEVLAKHEVRATFFLIGRYAQQRPDIVRAVLEGGHVIGNHTYSHRLLTFRSAAQIRAELEMCRRALSDAIGEHSNLFRPPFGGRRPAVLRIARHLGLAPVMWSVTGYDWNAPPADEIERKVTHRVRGGDVILLHDGGHLEMGADRSATVTATDRLIAKYQSEGRQFVTIPAMMEALTAGRRTTTGREPGPTPTDSEGRSRVG